MIGKVLRWGNSYGVRLSKGETEATGLREGDEIAFELKAIPRRKIDISRLHTFKGDGNLSVKHDEAGWA